MYDQGKFAVAILEVQISGAGEMAQQLKSLHLQRTRVTFQHSHSSLQLPVPPVPGEPTCCSSLCRHVVHVIHINK